MLAALCLALMARGAAALDTSARAALVVDHETGAVLMEKNADTPLPPASMSKLMTLYMLFEALADGRLSLDDTFRVSAKASDMGGSKMFVREGARVRIIDLIRGIVVQSGNDACIVVAEGLAGSEAAFAQQMTERARELGLEDSTFTNSTGWPHPAQRMSARDLVELSRRIIEDFPQFYPYFAETEFTWDDITQRNRNPLLYADVGADGLKTGHTQEAGYGLVASALRGERRILVMITGLDSKRARAEEAERLVNWAFREFRNERLFEAGEHVAQADVWLGETSGVPLVTGGEVVATLPFAGSAEVSLRAVYDGPVEAPIEQGEELGELVIAAEGLSAVSAPLVAGRAVARGGYMTRVQAAARELLSRLAAQF
jgi:D-alanyl-D-alanine carboxypeptidase (penicillin-binding protein 5/6)